MRTIKVRTADLLSQVKHNRHEHRDTFLKAQEVYRKRVIEELDQMQADARMGNKIRRFLSLPEPEDHTDDYDRVIRMLEMTVDDVIEIPEQEFAMYVMDDWGWKSSWTTSTASYVATS